jgi:hypothetical protein
MFTRGSAVWSAFVSLILVGCAGVAPTQALKQEALLSLQPVDVHVGISQSELYAAFIPSTAGASGAAACGAVPGLGIFLAAACGGALGAVDAQVNATRAKAAEESVRPLKDRLVDLDFDAHMQASVKRSLEMVPGMQYAGIVVTKTVNNKAYEQRFRASTANAVMFVNVDYHLTTDFSTLEASVRGLIYPRGPAARTAVGQSIALPSGPNEAVLQVKDTVYRSTIFYQAKLPVPAADIAQNVAAWNANDGRLVRAAMQDGIAQLGRLIADDLQRKSGIDASAPASVDVGNGLKARLVAQEPGGRLLRLPDGSLRFEADLSTVASTLAPVPMSAEPIAAAATGTTRP